MTAAAAVALVVVSAAIAAGIDALAARLNPLIEDHRELGLDEHLLELARQETRV